MATFNIRKCVEMRKCENHFMSEISMQSTLEAPLDIALSALLTPDFILSILDGKAWCEFKAQWISQMLVLDQERRQKESREVGSCFLF